MWAEFYRTFLNYSRDKNWSSKECKKNVGYVYEGRVAEYFYTINEQEPNLHYYDLVVRLEDFVKESLKTNSDEQRIQSLVECANWLDGMCISQVGASTPNDERIWVVLTRV